MTPEVAGPQAEASVAPAPVADQPVLDADQRLLLRAALNVLLPPHGELPGAGDLDVGASIERTLSTSPRLRRLVLHGLASLAIDRFIELPPAAKVESLLRIEHQQPASFTALVEHSYRGYYTLPAVHAALGYQGPPQPRGNILPPFDLELLRTQRERIPFWRRV